jgi:hypothetical protein
VDLRDFESILIFFSEDEIEELQAAIDERRSRRLACDGEDRPGSVEQPVYPLGERGAGLQKLLTAEPLINAAEERSGPGNGSKRFS